MRIAVIGSGISGLGFAYLAHKDHDIRIFEKASRIGGHAHTHNLSTAYGDIAVDSGFIVYNQLNYPNLTGMFNHLGIETIASDMSLSISLNGGEVEYEGSLPGLFAQKKNLFRPRFWSMLLGLISFYRNAYRQLDTSPPDETLGEFVKRCGYSDAFVEDHLLPMGGAIWSCPADQMRAYPVRSFLMFLENHRLMDFTNRPEWRTVATGSQQYVSALREYLSDSIHTDTHITAIRREGSGVILSVEGEGDLWFDKVVMAAHADESLALLSDASAAEHDILSAFSFTDNHVYLHSDAALMPQKRAAWGAWNYRAESDGRLSVTYWMNRLQSIDSRVPLFVSLNPAEPPQQHLIHAEADYAHPLFDLKAINAQHKLPDIQGINHIYWCGAWTANGFHEDGLKSAVATALSLGLEVPWETPTIAWHQPRSDKAAHTA